MENSASLVTPTLTGENTDAQLENQGYTYDQPGFTYDQAGVFYGGVYNKSEDIIPIMSLVEQVIPNIYGYSDIYSKFVPPSNQQIVGPGWFMYVSH